MDNYTAIERAIVWKLNNGLADAANGLLQNAVVEAYPDQASTLGKPTPAARFLVGYASSSFEILDEDLLNEAETVTYEITLEVANIRDHSGGYPLIQGAKQALHKFAPLRGNLRKLRAGRFSFQGREKNLWFWSLNFSCTLFSQYEYRPLDTVYPGAGQTPGSSDGDGGFPEILPDNFVLKAGLWRSISPIAEDESVLDQEFRFQAGEEG